MSYAPFLAPHRDAGLPVGRGDDGTTIYYTIPGISPATYSAVALTANRDHYVAWTTLAPLLIDQLVGRVTAGGGASTSFRLGIYRANGDLQPSGPPLADSGNLDASSTGVKTYTPSSPLYVPAGTYLSIVNTDGTPSLLGSVGGSPAVFDTNLGSTTPAAQYMYVARSYAAFPTPGTAWTAIQAAAHTWSFIFYRVKRP